MKWHKLSPRHGWVCAHPSYSSLWTWLTKKRKGGAFSTIKRQSHPRLGNGHTCWLMQNTGTSYMLSMDQGWHPTAHSLTVSPTRTQNAPFILHSGWTWCWITKSVSRKIWLTAVVNWLRHDSQIVGKTLFQMILTVRFIDLAYADQPLSHGRGLPINRNL